MRENTLSEEAIRLFRHMSGEPSTRYLSDFLIEPISKDLGQSLNLISLKEAVNDPIFCLKILFGHYVFGKRGKDRIHYARASFRALDSIIAEGSVDAFLSRSTAEDVWFAFLKEVGQEGTRAVDPNFRGPIQGLAELTQEAFRLTASGSITEWLVRGIRHNGRIESAFLRMVDIRGLGPKICSTFLRDIICLADVEDQVLNIDRLYLQPIDKWMRLVAPYVVDELADADAPDWVLAGKISRNARRAGVSGIRFNMGTNYVGMRTFGGTLAFSHLMEQMSCETFSDADSRPEGRLM